MSTERLRQIAEEAAENIEARLEECMKRIAVMCREHRGPRMSIPVDKERDDDVFICNTIRDALSLLRANKELVEENKKLREACGKALPLLT